MITIAIRIILTLAMLYFIYQETGVVTAIGFALLAISVELISVWMKQVNEILKLLGGMK